MLARMASMSVTQRPDDTKTEDASGTAATSWSMRGSYAVAAADHGQRAACVFQRRCLKQNHINQTTVQPAWCFSGVVSCPNQGF